MGEKKAFYSFLIFPLLSTTYCSPDSAQKNCGSDKTDVTPMLWEGLGKQSGRLPAQSDNWDSALMWVCKARCSRQHTYVCRRENRVQRLSLHCLHRIRTTCQQYTGCFLKNSTVKFCITLCTQVYLDLHQRGNWNQSQ